MQETTKDTIESWEFWTPLSKAVEKDGRRWIKGVASTEDKDLQGEVVKQGGIDFSYFEEYGFFNNDHKPGPENKVGEPTLCKHRADGLYVEGFLYVENEAANGIWNLIKSLKASGSSREMGMSLQGKTRLRAGKTILKSWVQDIAITAAPINTHTWVDILKSLSGAWCVNPSEEECVNCRACEVGKALVAGHGNPTATGGVSGEALRTESLDSDEKNQLFEADRKERRRLTKSQVSQWISETMGYTPATSDLYADVIFTIHGVRS